MFSRIKYTWSNSQSHLLRHRYHIMSLGELLYDIISHKTLHIKH